MTAVSTADAGPSRAYPHFVTVDPDDVTARYRDRGVAETIARHSGHAVIEVPRHFSYGQQVDFRAFGTVCRGQVTGFGRTRVRVWFTHGGGEHTRWFNAFHLARVGTADPYPHRSRMSIQIGRRPASGRRDLGLLSELARLDAIEQAARAVCGVHDPRHAGSDYSVSAALLDRLAAAVHVRSTTG